MVDKIIRRTHCIKCSDETWDKLCQIAIDNNIPKYEVIELIMSKITTIKKDVRVELKGGLTDVI